MDGTLHVALWGKLALIGHYQRCSREFDGRLSDDVCLDVYASHQTSIK